MPHIKPTFTPRFSGEIPRDPQSSETSMRFLVTLEDAKDAFQDMRKLDKDPVKYEAQRMTWEQTAREAFKNLLVLFADYDQARQEAGNYTDRIWFRQYSETVRDEIVKNLQDKAVCPPPMAEWLINLVLDTRLFRRLSDPILHTLSRVSPDA